MDSEKTRRTSGRYEGVGASPGIAIGEARIAERCRVTVVEVPVSPEEIPAEIERFTAALEHARRELEVVKAELAHRQDRDQHVYVIDAHLLILEDSTLLREIIGVIESEGINAEGALRRASRKFKDFFDSIPDEYLRERGGDVEVVLERILRNLVGKAHEPLPEFEGKVILVAHDLSPADILQLDRSKVMGIVTDVGGRTSHTAILARSFEIPAVVGLEKITSEISDGTALIIDGSAGVVEVDPDEETFRDYLKRKQHYEYMERELQKLKDVPAETPDGFRIRLQGNVEFAEEIPSVISHGGEGVGLYRTEVLFMNRRSLPDEEEQYQAYLAVVKAVAPHPATIRTLDAGGDKLVDVLHTGEELNPALGVRAIRLMLRHPDLFKTQLRAILRASAHGVVRMFFPMISGVAEIRQVKQILEEVKAELRSEGIPFDESIEIGIMIEIPSAVLTADLLAQEVDFFSVGTNDLIQYSLAIDRNNEHLVHLYEPLHPAILRSLKMVVDAAHAAGIRVCMCGEMAGEPAYLPILVGLGFDELSMNAVAIPRVKRILRRCTKTDAEEVVAKSLRMVTAPEIESYLRSEISGRFSESID